MAAGTPECHHYTCRSVWSQGPQPSSPHWSTLRQASACYPPLMAVPPHPRGPAGMGEHSSREPERLNWTEDGFPSPPLRHVPRPAGSYGRRGSRTCVLPGSSCVSVLEELDRRVATDTILLGQIRLFRGIDLCQPDLRAFCLQFPSSFGILRGQSLAVATPRGI